MELKPRYPTLPNAEMLLRGQTWTFARGEHIIIVRDIPRTIFRLSGLS
jgi:hypothetical protein